jgi:hypothetical protein
MITMCTEYAAHVHGIYSDSKEHAKVTGDHMKMLMLTLPFMVRDLIFPQVVCTSSTHQCILLCVCTFLFILVYTRTYKYLPVCTAL